MVGFHVLPDLRRYLYYLIDLTYRSNFFWIVPFQHPTELVVAGGPLAAAYTPVGRAHPRRRVPAARAHFS